jgi:hypothetical protein
MDGWTAYRYSFEYSANSIMSTIQYDKEATGKSKYCTVYYCTGTGSM